MASSMATTPARSSGVSARTARCSLAMTSMLVSPGCEWPLGRCIGECQLAIHVFVEKVVEQGQQRHRLFLDVGHLALDHLQRTALESVKPAVVERSRSGGACQRQYLGRNRADGVVLFLQQLRDIAFAGLGHAREQLAFLEVEMTPDVLLDEAAECAGELDEIGIACGVRARRSRERLLNATEQVEIAAMFGVERVADLAHETPRQPNNGIRIPEYRILLRRP